MDRAELLTYDPPDQVRQRLRGGGPARGLLGNRLGDSGPSTLVHVAPPVRDLAYIETYSRYGPILDEGPVRVNSAAQRHLRYPVPVQPDRARSRVEQMVEALASRGHRVTPQRLAILEVLAKSEGHPTANQVLSRVQRRFPMVGKATVYNTIQLLKDLGQVLELEFRDAANRYDGNMPEPHPHLVCTQCGRIDEVMSPTLHDTASRVADEVGYELLSHRFDVYGLCPSCKRKVDRNQANARPDVVAG